MAKDFIVKESDQDHYANFLADQLDAGAGAGLLVIYGGTPPANVTDPITGTEIVVIPLATPNAFGDSSAGVVSINAPPGPGTAGNTGTPTHFRFYESEDGAAVVDPGSAKHQGTAGLSDADLIVSKSPIDAGDEVTLQSFTITVAKSVGTIPP